MDTESSFLFDIINNKSSFDDRDQNELDAVRKIYSKLSSYSFEKLYIWLAATAIHPNNQLFSIRFEIIFACLLSIPPEKFENRKLNYQDFCNLLREFDITVSPFTVFLEDFKPFYQLKKIPLFTPESKYYFFYGSYEQPYLIWNHVIEIIYPVLSKLNHPLALTIKTSLDFQTQLIGDMENYAIEERNESTITIPPKDFLDVIGKRFLTNFSDEFARTVTSGALKKEKSLLSLAANGGLYDVLFIKHKNHKFFWLPFDHYDAISYIIKRTVLKNSLVIGSINNYSKGQFLNSLWGLFRITSGVENIYSINGEKLTSDIDAIAMIDEQNALMFKVAPLTMASNIEQTLHEAITCVRNIIKRLSEDDLVIFEFFNKQKDGRPKIKYWGVVVYDILASENVILPGINEENIFSYSHDDLCRCFEKSSSPEFLLNFLIDDHRQLLNGNIISPDMLDRFEVYLSGKGFLRAGQQPSMIVYAPHDGSIAVQNKMFEKFQDPIHEIIYRHFQQKYDMVKKHSSGDCYDICMKSTGAGGMGMLLGKHLLFIRFPWDIIYNENKDKIKHCSILLAPLILHFLERLKTQITEQLNTWTSIVRLPDLLQIDLIPAEDAKFIDAFHENINLSEQNPVMCKTFIKRNKLLTRLVYDSRYLHLFFSSYRDNTAEKIIFIQLYSSWFIACENINETLAWKKSSKLFDALIGKEQKGFSLDAIPVKNPLLFQYHSPYEFDEVMLGHKQQEIAKFLYDKNIMPGTYSADSAKSICNDIFTFLWNDLIESLSKLNSHALSFIYRQIELIEGKREQQQLSAGLQSRIRTDFDPIEKYKSDYSELVKLLETSKYIFQIAFSLSPTGDEHLTQLNWQKCLAIGWWMGEVSHISDALHFETANFDLSISDMYELSISYNGSRFCFEEFQAQHAKTSIMNEATSIEYRLNKAMDNKNAEKHKTYIAPQWLQIIDSAFHAEFGVTLSSFYIISDSLRFVECKKTDFPVKLFDSIEQLIEGIKNTLTPEDEITDQDIHNTINFMLMGNIDISTPLLPSKITTLNKRINITPLMEIEGQIAYGNQMTILSTQLLINILSHGSQPFDLSNYPRLKTAIKKIHRLRDLELEEKAYVEATECLGNIFVEKNICNFRRISKTLPQRPDCGEIDIIAVNQDLKTVFVLDAKNQKRERLPAGINREAKEFWGTGGHAEQLHKKELFIRDNIVVFLRYFKIADLEGWKTQSAFVTQTHYISAFIMKCEVDFVLLSDLKKYLQKGGIK